MPSLGQQLQVRPLLAVPRDRTTLNVACETGSDANCHGQGRRKGATGKVPVLHLPDGRVLNESNAILWYLGAGTDLGTSEPFAQAQIAVMDVSLNRTANESVSRCARRCLCIPRAHIWPRPSDWRHC